MKWRRRSNWMGVRLDEQDGESQQNENQIFMIMIHDPRHTTVKRSAPSNR